MFAKTSRPIGLYERQKNGYELKVSSRGAPLSSRFCTAKPIVILSVIFFCRPAFQMMYGAMRPVELPALARAVGFEFADCVIEGVEDDLCRDLLMPATFTVRFATALRGAESRIGLTTPIQHEAWRFVVAQGGRTVRTDAIAQAVGLTREHLSRRFAADGAPNLKRVIDLVRLLAAAEAERARHALRERAPAPA